MTGFTGLVYEGISAYQNLKKDIATEKGYKAIQSHQKLLKELYYINQELTSYETYEIATTEKV